MKYVSLISSTIFINGINRSCLVDIEKSIYCVVPKSLAGLFEGRKNFCYEEETSKLDCENQEVFEEYISFLEENNFVFVSDKEINFIHFEEKTNEIPYLIQDAIIDSNTEKDLINKLLFLSDKPENIQLRLFFSPNLKYLNDLTDFLKVNEFKNVEIVFNHNLNLNLNNYKSVLEKYNIISRLVIMGYEENRTLSNYGIVCVKEKLISQKQCGIISEKLFTPNIKTVIKSKGCNSCLYKKISIDKDGNIKNCPSMSESFGNIKNVTLEKAINHPDFRKYWNIAKDEIDVCKDCEFRHICTDCRAYIEEPENQYSKPLKCGYNPYTNVWEKWSTNPLKQKAIEYYGMQGLIK